jgi:hypothetical protein
MQCFFEDHQMNSEEDEFNRIELEASLRCPLCNYQHGHAIGCKNNSVDIALNKMAENACELGLDYEPVQQEPLEYWNAVEGWVKIDEVRKHFDSVGCATIYKSAGDGRVPLTSAQRTWVGLTDDEIEQGCKESWVTEQAFQSAVWWAEAKLKEKNT